MVLAEAGKAPEGMDPAAVVGEVVVLTYAEALALSLEKVAK